MTESKDEYGNMAIVYRQQEVIHQCCLFTRPCVLIGGIGDVLAKLHLAQGVGKIGGCRLPITVVFMH